MLSPAAAPAPSPSPSLPKSPFENVSASKTLPLPPGVYTLFPVVEKCDNLELPSGPWTASHCKTRWEIHSRKEQARRREAAAAAAVVKKPVELSSQSNSGTTTTVAAESSALDDDEEDEDESDHLFHLSQSAQASLIDTSKKELDPASFQHEYLTPFFLSLPPAANLMNNGQSKSNSGASTPLHRRRSSAASASGGPSFGRLTPLPSLRPSSPTYSHPLSSLTSTQAVDNGTRKEPKPQPIGFLRPSVIRALLVDNQKMVAMNCKPVWAFLPPVYIPPPPERAPSRRSSRSGSRTSSRRGSHSVLNPLSPNGGGGMQPLSTPPIPADSSSTIEPSGTPNLQSAGEGPTPFVLRDVLEDLRAVETSGSVSSDRASGGGGNGKRLEMNVIGPYAIGFEDWVNQEGFASRREHMDRIVRGWKMAGIFSEVLGGWRDEEYTVYGPPVPVAEGDNPLPGSNVALSMERSACALFGVATFGVHCTAYVEKEGEPLKIWVPRRSSAKQTWPNYLDNTVAGGITAGDSPRESIIRECEEEASLDPSFVKRTMQSTSVIVYNYRTETGWIQPEVQYIYDLKLPSDGSIAPKVNANDGEVDSFMLMEVEEVVRRMVESEFKPNCAMVLCDFFLRHGYLTPESDTRFLELATRLRRDMILPGPA